MVIIECLESTDLPEGVVNYFTGPGREVGGTFTTHHAVDVVSFTGGPKSAVGYMNRLRTIKNGCS